MALEDFESAAADCTTALERGLEPAALYTLRMQARYDSANFKDALRDCRAALRAGGESEDLYLMLGHVYMCLMRPDLALREGYDRALQLNPESPGALGGAMSTRVFIEGLTAAETNFDPSTGPVGALDSALSGLLPTELPSSLDSELIRLARDGSFPETIPIPRSLLQGRRRPSSKGERG